MFVCLFHFHKYITILWYMANIGYGGLVITFVNYCTINMIGTDPHVQRSYALCKYGMQKTSSDPIYLRNFNLFSGRALPQVHLSRWITINIVHPSWSSWFETTTWMPEVNPAILLQADHWVMCDWWVELCDWCPIFIYNIINSETSGWDHLPVFLSMTLIYIYGLSISGRMYRY